MTISMKKLKSILQSLMYDPNDPFKPVRPDAKPYIKPQLAAVIKNGKTCKKRVIIGDTAFKKQQRQNDPTITYADQDIIFRYVGTNPPQYQCPSCNKVNDLDDTVCQHCGEVLEEIIG